MKKLLLLSFTLTVLLASCNSGDPVKFNDTIVSGLTEVDTKMEILDDLIYNSDYENAELILDSLKSHVSDCKKNFSGLKYKSGEDFKNKSLEMLQLLQSEYLPAYKAAIEEYRIADDIEDEDEVQDKYDEIFSKLEAVSDKYSVLDDELIEIQKKFAKNNNIDLI